ncbi:copper ion binding protein [Clostridium cavendishii DSM 21758]|uniref:Copper ion binding protein n=1 Tax=Clostridium cavendishii DSM 21758 TaxID=1121302 RepID=A0A1M6J8K4_9CLOT|nr:heavy metal-associated domain-containing protein [Clostridium cavendishii]SHJ43036.1 copper ion binding protein [Clostridium cavendishii DSM 21758]
MIKKRILIEGMSCEHCVNHVRKVLQKLEGVTKIEVNLKGNFAIIEAADNVRDGEIEFAIDNAGYEVLVVETL